MEFEFSKAPTVETLDKVPEQFRGLYQESAEGGFALADNFKGIGAAVDGLNKSLKAARRDADEGRRNKPDLSKYAEIGQLLGLDPENAADAEALRTAVERTISESKDGKVNWDKMKVNLENGFKTQLQAKDQELSAKDKTLTRYLISSEATRAIAAAKGVPELLLPQIQAQTKVIKDGDEYVVRVIDSAGDPRGNASGGFMSVAELVNELKASPTFGRAFESEAPSGHGVKPNTNNQRLPVPKAEMSSVDRIKAGLDKRTKR
jgi:hypothetical protein